MREKLKNIKNMLRSDFIFESNSKRVKKEKVDIDLEKELNYPDNTKDEYVQNIIDVINKMIEGTANITDLEKAVKNKKKNEK